MICFVIFFGRITSTRDFHEIYSFLNLSSISLVSSGECLFYHFSQKDLPCVILDAFTWILPCVRSKIYFVITHVLKRCGLLSIPSYFWIYINKRILVLFSLLNDSHSKKYRHQSRLILLRYWHFVSILYRIFFTYSRIKRVKLWSIFLVHFSNIYIDRANIRLSIYLH